MRVLMPSGPPCTAPLALVLPGAPQDLQLWSLPGGKKVQEGLSPPVPGMMGGVRYPK